jgi:hypothetical protein
VNADGTVTAPGAPLPADRAVQLRPHDPELLRKIKALSRKARRAGPPAASVSLSGYPACDEEIRKTAGELWTAATARRPRARLQEGARAVRFSLKRAGPAGDRADFQSGRATRKRRRRTFTPRQGADIYSCGATRGSVDPETDRLGLPRDRQGARIWEPMTGADGGAGV